MLSTQFDEKITVRRDNGATGDDGGWVSSWTDNLVDVPCKIDWRSGQEVVINDRITSRKDATVCTAILDITATDRIVHDSILFDIVSVIKPANKFMKIEIKRNTEES